MMKLMFLLLLCHVASSVRHSLQMYVMISSGVPNVPDYLAGADVEDVIIAYYDSNMKAPELRQDWGKELKKDHLQLCKEHAQMMIFYQQKFEVATRIFKQNSNQTGGAHFIQEFTGCEWDDETEVVNGFKQFGYNGEDFIALDTDTETWTTSNPQAEIVKELWNGYPSNGFWKNFFTAVCPAWLKIYLNYIKSFVSRKVLPSVSLLQKTPSSPVSCHATGFYPDRAMMFWRKDGKEIHEDVDYKEILFNEDGTFQMSVDLSVSSFRPEDWRSYDCVFQLSGIEDDIITGLNKSAIRTNWGKTGNRNDGERPSDTTIPIFAVAVVLVVILIVAVGFTVHRKIKVSDKLHPSLHGNFSQLSERLNPETT